MNIAELYQITNEDGPFYFTPDYDAPPGDTLREVMGELHMGVVTIAFKSGLKCEDVLGVLSGERPITHTIASSLELATGVPARLWLSLERQYRKVQKRLKSNKDKEGGSRRMNIAELSETLMDIFSEDTQVVSINAHRDVIQEPPVAGESYKRFRPDARIRLIIDLYDPKYVADGPLESSSLTTKKENSTMKEGWNDAKEVLPPVGLVCEVMFENDINVKEGKNPPARATLVRTVNWGYVWAKGENDRPEFRSFTVRYWRIPRS